MTQVRSSERGSDRGSFILLGLIVVAIAASIVMLVTGSVGILKIALIISLWAAFIGLFLVARSRKETEHERHLKQQEAAVARAEITRLEEAADSESETLAEIREQLEVMRTQLEALTNLAFPESGMIQAEARRIDELPASPRRPFFDTSSFPAVNLMTGNAPAQEEPEVQEPLPEVENLDELAAEIAALDEETIVLPADEPALEGESVEVTVAKEPMDVDPEPLFPEDTDEEEGEFDSGRRHSASASGAVSVAELLRRKQDEQASAYHGRRRKEDRL